MLIDGAKRLNSAFHKGREEVVTSRKEWQASGKTDDMKKMVFITCSCMVHKSISQTMFLLFLYQGEIRSKSKYNCKDVHAEIKQHLHIKEFHQTSNKNKIPV